MVKHYDLIVFDWDGTLMDSTARIISSMQNAAELSSLPVPTSTEVADIIGLSLNTAFDVLFGNDLLTPTKRDELFQNYRQQFIADNDELMPMFPGAEALVERLHLLGVKLAVATGKSRVGLNRALSETEVGALFHDTICADEANSKPDPEMLDKLSARMKVNKARMLMIGDTGHDLGMAANAGVDSLGVTYGAQSAERLAGHRPKAILNSIEELVSWLFSEHQDVCPA
ncbi:HAD family hydrolase [Corallincola platygyrae]|uniref:HAD family hydrolase n=1 Tax=Corallincola platygyrae TaxID=1193278 RepID=A0ABW4XJD8_9GAMM